MTTFQDPPPQSRRSARQSERGEQQLETPPFGQNFVEQQDSPPATGRRARPTDAEQFEANPEPLNYTTQGREPASYDEQLPAAGYAPAPQEPAPFRVRDFSPEGGRRAAVPPLIEPPQQQASPAGASDLDYRTQAGPPAPVVDAAAEPVVQQTMSRRELRLRQAQADAAAGIVPPELDAPPAAEPNPALLTQPPVPNPALLTQPPVPNPALLTQPPVPNPALLTQPPVPNPSLLTAPPPAMPAPEPADIVDAELPSPFAASLLTAPPPVGPPSSTVTTPPAQPTPPPATLSNAMAEVDSLTGNDAPPAPQASERVDDAPVFLEPEIEDSPWVAPVGHWSRQADLDDETQPWENTITRDVGGGNVATTTSALVLPEIPRPSNFSTALDSTGEVLLTGSIDLPPSLSTAGGDARRYDDPNVDLMFDTQDAEFTGTDSSPVRAIRAVSTHTSSRGVIHANKPHGNRLIVVVFIATAVLAVGVVGMLVASLALNLF